MAGDLTQEKVQKEVVDYAINKFNRLDGLILNAGVLEPVAKLADANIADWKKLYDVNFFSIVSMVSDKRKTNWTNCSISRNPAHVSLSELLLLVLFGKGTIRIVGYV